MIQYRCTYCKLFLKVHSNRYFFKLISIWNYSIYFLYSTYSQTDSQDISLCFWMGTNVLMPNENRILASSVQLAKSVWHLYYNKWLDIYIITLCSILSASLVRCDAYLSALLLVVTTRDSISRIAPCSPGIYTKDFIERHTLWAGLGKIQMINKADRIKMKL